MATITIHYAAPPTDPLKIFRPHHVTLAPSGMVTTEGGELGVVQFLGFTKTEAPTFDKDSWLATTDLAKQLSADSVGLDGMIGWYAAFLGEGGPFSFSLPVTAVDVLTDPIGGGSSE